MKKFSQISINKFLQIGFLIASLLIGIVSISFAETSNTTEQSSVKSSEKPKINFSPIFILLSDAMGAIKANNPTLAKNLLLELQQEFNKIHINHSTLGKQANESLIDAINNPTIDNLSSLSNALYAFEKEQNPVDYSEKRKIFAKKVMPAYEQLNQAINATNPQDLQSVETVRQANQQFNNIWVANERVVRNTSKGHYGKIETAMALIRVSIESQPANVEQMKAQSAILKQALDGFNAGETAIIVPNNYHLNDGINLLREGLQAFQTADNVTGQTKLGEFINIWPSIEGEVSTRNANLYARIESQVPVIMANGNQQKQQEILQGLIAELSQINPSAKYTAIDSMLILLREGLEALLIVMALISALTVANQPKGKKWVYAGVIAGLLASVAGAIALQQLFPAMTSGENREMLEGLVGILAVVMMIGIGAWLHSKSSVKSWNAYIQKHMGQALTTGSFVSLFGLSFLSVFREGAETILFYVGILPNITMTAFLTGIGMALIILAVVAIIMLKTSVKLPIPLLFKVLTWTIYLLGFKILGVSLHALQLTGYLKMTIFPNIPAIEMLGIYSTLETLIAQLLYIVIVILLQIWIRRSEKISSSTTLT